MAESVVQRPERRADGIVGAPAGAALRGRLELAVDRVIDQRYRISEPLGAGGSSQVYLAHDSALKREVAIKVLDDQAAADGALRKMFVKEARALAQLSHPNIVAVHDVGEVDGRPYIVMEHVEGSSLKALIDRSGALPLAEALRLASGIAAGLSVAHAKDIVHADLKPSNVLLDKDDRPKICDFGIARTPQEEAETPQLFATALYVAPERVEGKHATAATDIYGLGLVLYEMLVGRPPFTSTSAAVLLRDHVVRQPVPPSHLRPSLPRELDKVVLKALAKDPALRYARASDLAKELNRIAAAEALGTVRPGTTQVMTEPMKGFVPSVLQSPVVALLSTYGLPLRRGFFAFFAALPVFGLFVLADFGALSGLLAAVLVAAIAAAGQLGVAMALAWIVATGLLFLFVPGLALLFAAMGVFMWLRDFSAERAAMALAMPVAAPLGLAPALVLTSAIMHGLGGVLSVALGALLTVIYAIASGRQTLGAYVQTGLTLEQESLFSQVNAAQMKSALLQVLRPSGTEGRFDLLMERFEPGELVAQMAGIVSRISAADTTALASMLSWIVAALVVWTVTRLLRMVFDTLLLRRRGWFALYVFATAVGVVSGAGFLYMLFITTAPLALAPGRLAEDTLFLTAAVGAVLALAFGVVISATERPEAEVEPLPTMAGRHIPVR